MRPVALGDEMGVVSGSLPGVRPIVHEVLSSGTVGRRSSASGPSTPNLALELALRPDVVRCAVADGNAAVEREPGRDVSVAARAAEPPNESRNHGSTSSGMAGT